MHPRRAFGRASRLTAITGIVLAIATLMAPVAVAANRLNVDVNLPAGFKISGMIANPAGVGIANVSVVAFKSDFSDFGFATTNASGNYTLQGLEAGSYQVQANPPGTANYRGGYWINNPPNNYSATPAGYPITVGPNQINKNMRLPTGFTIAGKITNSAGTPIAGVTVSASGPSFRGATTNASGDYVIRGLAAGGYKLSLTPPTSSNYQYGYYGPTAPNHFVKTYAAGATVTVGPNKTGINARLPNALTISGRITNTAGTALAGVSVSATDSMSRSAVTNSSGNYTIRGLDPGDYEIFFSPPGNYQEGYYTTANANHFIRAQASATPVHVGPSKTGINAKLPSAFKITGKITNNAGVAIAGAFVSAGGFAAFAITNASGNYVLQGLEPGAYKVMATPPATTNYRSGWWNTTANHFSDTEAGGTNITVGPNKVANMKLPTGYIIGDLIKGAGTPVSGAFVTASGTNGSKGAVTNTSTTANYKIQGLRAGTYTVAISAPFGSNLLDGWYRAAAPNNFTTDQSLATPVTVGP
jgi:protocatechuate 3,4-dioxygenase beta subunit